MSDDADKLGEVLQRAESDRSSRPWRPETVLRLFSSLLLCFAGGGLCLVALSAALRSAGQTPPKELAMIVGGLSVHGAAVPLLLWFVRSNDTTLSEAFGLRVGKAGRVIGWGVLTGLVSLPVVYGLQRLSMATLERLGLEVVMQENVKLLMESGLGFRIYLGIFAVGLAPLVEEALFRGVLFTFCRDLGFLRVAFWGNALLFGLIHFNSAAFVPLSVFGGILAWLYHRTGNLLAPCAAHVVFNLAPFIMVATGFAER